MFSRLAFVLIVFVVEPTVNRAKSAVALGGMGSWEPYLNPQSTDHLHQPSLGSCVKLINAKHDISPQGTWQDTGVRKVLRCARISPRYSHREQVSNCSRLSTCLISARERLRHRVTLPQPRELSLLPSPSLKEERQRSRGPLISQLAIISTWRILAVRSGPPRVPWLILSPSSLPAALVSSSSLIQRRRRLVVCSNHIKAATKFFDICEAQRRHAFSETTLKAWAKGDSRYLDYPETRYVRESFPFI